MNETLARVTAKFTDDDKRLYNWLIDHPDGTISSINLDMHILATMYHLRDLAWFGKQRAFFQFNM